MTRNPVMCIGEDTRELFAIHLLDDGRYLAVRSETPFFALEGDTIVDVATRAQAVFDFHKERR